MFVIVMRVLGGFLVLVLALVASLAADFYSRSLPFDASKPVPVVGVIFSGDSARIRLGLELLESGAIEKLYISGANPRGGVRPDVFATQHHLTPFLISKYEAGQIILASQAKSTIGNARETACWLESVPETHELALITSRWHMPRASLALERAIPPGVEVVRITSETTPRTITEEERRNSEFFKYVATWFTTLLPVSQWPMDVQCPT